MENEKKDIVIVLCKGYAIKQISTFLLTLKYQSPESYLLLFSDNSTISYANDIYNNNGKVIGIELLNNYPYYPSYNIKYPISRSFLYNHIPRYINNKFHYFYHTLRFFLSNAWLAKYSRSYNSILLCDIRDIMFQKNPFLFYNRSGLYFQQEMNDIITKNINYRWIKPYNPSKNILLNTMINSGNILGSTKDIKHFLSQFCSFMKRTRIQTAEQGSLNYFIYSNQYNGNYVIERYGYGFTLLLYIPLITTQDNATPVNNYIYNYDKSIPPIIHSYQLGLDYGSIHRKRKFKEYIFFHTNNSRLSSIS